MTQLPHSALSPDEQLARCERLRDIKRGMVAEPSRYPCPSPFAAGTVARSDGRPDPWDVPSIHGDAFEAILKAIRAVHSLQEPRILPLLGAAGMGKSHLLARFNDDALARSERFVLVRCLGTIRAAELEVVLLDRLLTALCAPSPSQRHLLLERLQEVAFCALNQLVAAGNQEVQQALKRRRLHWLGSWFGGSNGLAALRDGLRRRDPKVFGLMEDHRFADFTARRFLPEPSQPFHRTVLGKLLAYLHEEERDQALAWLRGYPVESTPPLGRESVETGYQRQEILKILLSLFTPEISAGLRYGSAEGPPREADTSARVFLITFDQIEGQLPLFAGDAEWHTYFAVLANLYHRLCNVVFLFPMPPEMFDGLHAQMESGFQHRIRRDLGVRLQPIRGEDAVELYTARLRLWLGDDAGLAGTTSLRCLPFDAATVQETAQATPTLRDLLVRLDHDFRAYFEREVHDDDPRIDFLYHCQQVRAQLAGQWGVSLEDWAGLRDLRVMDTHPDTVTQLLNLHGAALARLWGLEYDRMEPVEHDRLDARLLLFRVPPFRVPPSNSRVQVRVVFLRRDIDEPRRQGVALLHGRQGDRNFVHFVRHRRIEPGEERPGQVFAHELSPEDEVRLLSLLRLLEGRQEFDTDARLGALVREELCRTYLGALLDQTAAAVQAVVARNAAPLVAAPAEEAQS